MHDQSGSANRGPGRLRPTGLLRPVPSSSPCGRRASTPPQCSSRPRTRRHPARARRGGQTLRPCALSGVTWCRRGVGCNTSRARPVQPGAPNRGASPSSCQPVPFPPRAPTGSRLTDEGRPFNKLERSHTHDRRLPFFVLRPPPWLVA